MCDGITEIIKKSEFVDNELFKVHLFDISPPSLILRVELKIKIDTYDFELEARNQFIGEVLRLADKFLPKSHAHLTPKFDAPVEIQLLRVDDPLILQPAEVQRLTADLHLQPIGRWMFAE